MDSSKDMALGKRGGDDGAGTDSHDDGDDGAGTDSHDGDGCDGCCCGDCGYGPDYAACAEPEPWLFLLETIQLSKARM